MSSREAPPRTASAAHETFWTTLDTPVRSVCLVIPPSSFLLDERVFVSLGLLKVAAALERRGHRVTVVDLSGIENFLEPLGQYLAASRDHVFGLTTTTPQLPAVMKIAERIRTARPDARLILGGPHVTLCASGRALERRSGVEAGRAARAMARLEAAFDTLVSGDGELAVFQAIRPDAPKLVDADDMAGGYFLSDAAYEASPPPARHLVDLSTYRYRIGDRPATSLIAQLGCPFSCGFCGGRNSKSLRVIRTRSIASIISEVEQLYRAHGFTGFMFYDDELNVNKQMLELMDALSDLQERLGVDFRLRGFIKSELFTPAQAAAMYRAGFRWLLCGYEAADPRILTNIDKKASIDDNSRCVEVAKAAGLRVKALMSCGHPGETADTIGAIADWLVRMRVDDFDCTIITTYPGTPYYDLARPHETLEGVWTYVQPKTGDRLHAYEVDYAITANYYKGDPDDGYLSFVFTDALSAADLVRLRDQVERSVRHSLGIPFNASRPAVRYEHSMGQGLPGFILRQAPRTASARLPRLGG